MYCAPQICRIGIRSFYQFVTFPKQTTKTGCSFKLHDPNCSKVQIIFMIGCKLCYKLISKCSLCYIISSQRNTKIRRAIWKSSMKIQMKIQIKIFLGKHGNAQGLHGCHFCEKYVAVRKGLVASSTKKKLKVKKIFGFLARILHD